LPNQRRRVTIPGSVADRVQRVFIGDLQGCADELDDLLAALPYDPSRHTLWFTGDLVNRGPASLRSLRRVIELEAESVLGNHDVHLLAVAAGIRPSRKNDTLADVLAAPDRDALLDWLLHRPLIRTWDDVVLVHAGLRPQWDDPERIARPLEARIAAGDLPVDDPDLHLLTNVRHLSAEGELVETDDSTVTDSAPWDHFYLGGRIVVCGHGAARGLVVKERLRALDSGCVWGGRLTAWIAEEDRVVSVPARRVWATRGT
jgi:bis(5'-nucleosyl)-tetraphosphatase (symmetrical)